MSRKAFYIMGIACLLILAGPVASWGQTVWEGRVASGEDDIEEHVPAGNMDITSSDIELASEDTGASDPQIVGVRFLNVVVPQGSAIVNAYIEFVCDETKDGSLPVSLIIQAELNPDAPAFATTTNNLSNRPVTTATAVWEPVPWTAADQIDQTSDISSVIEEIVNLPGWSGNGTIVLMLRDNPDNPSAGLRGAESYNGEPDSAALLHIEWEPSTKAKAPIPGQLATDVTRDTLLTWMPGLPSDTLYLGTVFEDVNSATVASHTGVTMFSNVVDAVDPGRLEFGTQYFWRVDGGGVKGNVWDFTVESLSYLVPIGDVNAVASSEVSDAQNALRAIDGSGFSDGLHSTDDTQMWLSAATGEASASIQFDFNRTQLLQKMMIWNYNAMSEAFVGWGAKDVTVETSLDGENWSVVEGVTIFNQGSGTPSAAATDVFEFATPIAAMSVRIVIHSNYGGIVMQYGLSEVQFYALPTYAAGLEPAEGTSIDIGNAPMFTWHPGRNVDQHSVLLSTDANTLTEVATLSEAQIDVASLDLAVGQTYYWQIDEVNQNELPSVYAGDVQSFSTLPYIMVDDFDQYGNTSPSRPFQTWTDGFGYSADEYFTAGYGGNGTGAGIGHDVWSLASPQYNGDIMESGITIPGSAQSMPFYYNGNSETTRTFAQAQDWTKSGVTTLALWFYGDAGNTAAQMYVKINTLKVQYSGNTSDLQLAGWQPWSIDLASLSINLQSVTSLSIGVEGAGASGVLLLDDIALYPSAIEPLNEWRVSASTDDGEEHPLDSGVMEGLGSSDLELGHEGAMSPEAQQIIGCRWTGIAIPKGATITEAWVQFSADDVDNDYHQGAVSQVITGELPINPVTFTDSLKDISNRPATAASAVWDIPVWTETHLMGPGERTPDISNVLQEIVNHDGWTGTVVLMFADNPAKPSQGCREAESYDGTPSEAPLLHITYE